MDSVQDHWPEYLMEAGELAIYMFATCLFATLLQHPASPVRHPIQADVSRRALMGLAIGAIYRISQDRANKIVILAGAGGEFIPAIDFSTFGNVADPAVWSQVHDEGVQILENIANIRVPVIAAVEGQANVHSEYALLANVIVAGEGATFNDLPHFAGGIVPSDGIFTVWSYRAGAGRAEAFLLNPQPLTAHTAHEWGVVAEVVPIGKALSRARELAALYLKAPEVTRRNSRAHFIQPLKERIVREVGYGLSLEGASAAELVNSTQAKIA